MSELEQLRAHFQQSRSAEHGQAYLAKAVAEKRRFVKGLRVNLDVDTPIASLVLKDTGEEACARRAKLLWNFTGVFAMLGTNILIWGHVLVALWRLWFG